MLMLDFNTVASQNQSVCKVVSKNTSKVHLDKEF